MMSKKELDLQFLNEIDCNQGAVRAVRFNVDGSYCLTCGSDKKLKLWNPYKNLLLKTYGGHGNEVLDACASCDSSQIVSCSSDKLVVVWDVTTGQSKRRFRGHAASVSCVRFNEESNIAVSGSLDNTVMFWDLRSRKNDPVQILREAKDCVTSLEIVGHEILAGSVDCFVRRYDIRNGSCDADFVAAAVTSVKFSHDNQCILVSSSDNVVRLLDKKTGELLGEYLGHNTNNLNIECAIMTSDNHVLSGSADGKLWCWDLISGNMVKKLIHREGKALNSVSVHPTKDVVLTACVNSIKVWGSPEQQIIEVEAD